MDQSGNTAVVHARFHGTWCFGHRRSKAQSAGSSALISGQSPSKTKNNFTLDTAAANHAVQDLVPRFHAKAKAKTTNLIWDTATDSLKQIE